MRLVSMNNLLQDPVVIQHKNSPNYQDKLKFIGLCGMIIDHIGLFFCPNFEVLRVIGRIAMPIFAFFAGYNFKNRPKSLILKYAILMQVIFFALNHFYYSPNILFTLYIGQWYLKKMFIIYEDFLSNLLQIIVLIIMTPATFVLFEYGTLAIAFMAIGYLCKNHKPEYIKHYVCVLAIANILFSQIIFAFDFHNFILTITIGITLFLLLNSKDGYLTPVNKKITFFSRNILQLYVVHYLLFLFTWYYLMIK